MSQTALQIHGPYRNTQSPAEELRVSDYLVTSDLTAYGMKGMLVLSTRTSALKVIDQALWSKVKSGETSLCTPDELASLHAAKILVNKSGNEQGEVLQENLSFIKKNRQFKLIVQPTAACPLGCGYCGQDHSAKHMTAENQAHLYEFAKKRLAAGHFDEMHVGWFGSEPLAAVGTLERMSLQLQEIAKERGLRYTASIVTNGLMLTEAVFKRLAGEHKVSKFEITLDGLQEDHDQRRPMKAGQGSFTRIYRNLQAIAKVKPDNVAIVIRCNVDGRNRASIPKLIDKLADDGLQAKVAIYFAQIHSWGNDAHQQAAEKEEYAAWEIEWLCKLIERGFRVNAVPPRKPQVCLAVNPKNFLVDPFGGVFGCTEVSLVNSYVKNGSNVHQLGHVQDDQLPQEKRRAIFGDYNEEIRQGSTPCSQCRVMPLCGGHCPKAWKEGKDIPCPSFKYNMEERMVLAYMQASRSLSSPSPS